MADAHGSTEKKKGETKTLKVARKINKNAQLSEIIN